MAQPVPKEARSGFACAAVMAAGIGCFAMGLLTTLSEASSAIGNALNWSAPVGSLSGKSTLAVVIWLVCWGLLHLVWNNRTLYEERVFQAAYVLIALGFLLTFPPIFGLF